MGQGHETSCVMTVGPPQQRPSPSRLQIRGAREQGLCENPSLIALTGQPPSRRPSPRTIMSTFTPQTHASTPALRRYLLGILERRYPQVPSGQPYAALSTAQLVRLRGNMDPLRQGEQNRESFWVVWSEMQQYWVSGSALWVMDGAYRVNLRLDVVRRCGCSMHDGWAARATRGASVMNWTCC